MSGAADRGGRGRRGRSLIVRGLVTLLPAAFTVLILVTAIQFVDRYVTTPINSTIYWALEGNALGWGLLDRLGIDPLETELVDPTTLPATVEAVRDRYGPSSPEFLGSLAQHRNEEDAFLKDLSALAVDPVELRREVSGIVHPLIGVLLTVLLVAAFGYLASGFLGRRLVSTLDRALHALPVVRSVYPYTKQLVDFFLSDTELEFEAVVAVPYPSPGLWSIGLVTGAGLRSLREREERRMLSIFVPSSPMPMTGWTVFVAADRVVPLAISVDQALRVTVSGGVLVPPSERVEDLERGLAAAAADPPSALPRRRPVGARATAAGTRSEPRP